MWFRRVTVNVQLMPPFLCVSVMLLRFSYFPNCLGFLRLYVDPVLFHSFLKINFSISKYMPPSILPLSKVLSC